MGPDAEAHAAVAQERARVQVHELREAQDLRVELHGPIDVADREPEIASTLRRALAGHAGLPHPAASTLPRRPDVVKAPITPERCPPGRPSAARPRVRPPRSPA